MHFSKNLICSNDEGILVQNLLNFAKITRGRPPILVKKKNKEQTLQFGLKMG